VDEKAAVETLRQLKEVFDKYGLEFWLDCGTLLGAIRDKRIIPWDHDIDLGILESESKKFFSTFEKLRQNGFNVRYTENDNSVAIFKDSKKKCFISISIYEIEGDKAVTSSLVNDKYYVYHKDGIKIRRSHLLSIFLVRYILWLLSAPKFIGDKPAIIPRFLHISLTKIFRFAPSIYRQKITGYIESIVIKFGFRHRKREVSLKYFEKFSEIIFYGMKFKVPSKPEDYLAYKYGNNWKIPKRDYNCFTEEGTFRRKK